MKLKFISALLCLEDSLLRAKSLNLELSLAPRLRKMSGSEFKVSGADVVKTKTSPRRNYLMPSGTVGSAPRPDLRDAIQFSDTTKSRNFRRYSYYPIAKPKF